MQAKLIEEVTIVIKRKWIIQEKMWVRKSWEIFAVKIDLFIIRLLGRRFFFCLFVCLFDKYITCHYLKRLNSLPNIFIFIRVLTSQTLNVSLII